MKYLGEFFVTGTTIDLLNNSESLDVGERLPCLLYLSLTMLLFPYVHSVTESRAPYVDMYEPSKLWSLSQTQDYVYEVALSCLGHVLHMVTSIANFGCFKAASHCTGNHFSGVI